MEWLGYELAPRMPTDRSIVVHIVYPTSPQRVPWSSPLDAQRTAHGARRCPAEEPISRPLHALHAHPVKPASFSVLPRLPRTFIESTNRPRLQIPTKVTVPGPDRRHGDTATLLSSVSMPCRAIEDHASDHRAPFFSARSTRSKDLDCSAEDIADGAKHPHVSSPSASHAQEQA